jgi:hypothetical protein
VGQGSSTALCGQSYDPIRKVIWRKSPHTTHRQTTVTSRNAFVCVSAAPRGYGTITLMGAVLRLSCR